MLGRCTFILRPIRTLFRSFSRILQNPRYLHFSRMLPEECRLLAERSSKKGAESQLSSSAHSPRPLAQSPGMGPAAAVEWPKLIFCICYLAIAGFSNWAVFSYTHDYVGREALPDLLFNLFDEQEWAAAWGDYSVTLTLIMLISLVVFHKQRVVVAKRAIFIAGTMYAMRSVTLLFTQLPPGYTNNYNRCRDQNNVTLIRTFLQRLWEQTYQLGFQDDKTNMLCGDLLFSGHTLVMMTCTLSINYYLPKKLKLLGIVPYLVSLFGVSCLIISRTHYTIDVVFAYWLTTFVFTLYHAYVEVDIYVERRTSILHSLFIMKIAGWLEENIVPGRVENELELPFSSFIHKHILKRAPGHHKQISIRTAQSNSSVFSRETEERNVCSSSSSTFGLP